MTNILDMPNQPPKLTDEQKRQWANDPIRRRAEFGGKVYELSKSGTVYVLERHGSAPKKPGETSFLELVQVIDQPEMSLRLKINDKAELYTYDQD